MLETPFIRFLLASACIVVIVAGIKALSAALIIVLFAILIAQCIHPLTVWLRSKKISSLFAVIITVLVVIIVGVAVISVLAGAVNGIRSKLPEYSVRIGELTEGLVAQLSQRGIDLGESFNNAVHSEQIQSLALVLLGAIASLIGNGIFILILVVVLLIEFETISEKVNKKAYVEGSFLYRIADLNNLSSKFIGIQALIGLMQGVLSTLILVVMGVDFALLWGILFFFLNFVPAVGFLFAVIMPTTVALIELGTTKAIIVLASWYALNIFFDNVVRPRMLKQSFDVSFITVLLILIFWTYVLGPAGAILAIPLSLSLKMIYDSYIGKKSAPLITK